MLGGIDDEDEILQLKWLLNSVMEDAGTIVNIKTSFIVFIYFVCIFILGRNVLSSDILLALCSLLLLKSSINFVWEVCDYLVLT